MWLETQSCEKDSHSTTPHRVRRESVIDMFADTTAQHTRQLHPVNANTTHDDTTLHPGVGEGGGWPPRWRTKMPNAKVEISLVFPENFWATFSFIQRLLTLRNCLVFVISYLLNIWQSCTAWVQFFYQKRVANFVSDILLTVCKKNVVFSSSMFCGFNFTSLRFLAIQGDPEN